MYFLTIMCILAAYSFYKNKRPAHGIYNLLFAITVDLFEKTLHGYAHSTFFEESKYCFRYSLGETRKLSLNASQKYC